jgi:hypothetical protein
MTAGVRRRMPTWLAAVGAGVVALGVGLPVGLLGGSGTAGPAPATPATPTTQAAPAPSVDRPPDLLAPSEATLWASLRMGGVDRQSCRSYPEGEQLAGAIASIACTVQDGSLSEPIYYHQFRNKVAVDAYMDMRAAPIVASRRGSCATGGEADTRWNSGSGPLGRLVCVDNTKNGTTFYKMAWSSDATDAVAIIQDESRSGTWAWWYAHGGSQFGPG